MLKRRLPDVIEWLGRHELAVLLAVLVVFGGTWVFIELADEVREGSTQSLDEAILRGLRDPDNPAVPLGPDWMTEAGRDLTALGGAPVLLLATAAVAGFLLLARRFAAMGFVLVAVFGGAGIIALLKAVFSRARPEVVPHLSHVYSSSFPSGHSMMSAVVYLTLGAILARMVTRRRLKFYFLCVALVLTGLVGCSRVYMGVHYPTDVLAGWTAGSVWATLCWLVARKLQHRGKIDQHI